MSAKVAVFYVASALAGAGATSPLGAAALLSASQAGATSPRTQASEAARLFAEGKAQVEAQCADCMGSTGDGLAAGLKAVRAALDEGYPGRAEAWRLLAEGYGALAWAFLPPDSPAQKEALAAQREAYERWLEIEPKNTGALYDYAFTFSEAGPRRRVLERLLDIDPGHIEGLYGLGQIDVEQGRVEEGLARMRKAFEAAQANPDLAIELGEGLLAAYEERKDVGLASEMSRCLAELRARKARLDRGEPER